MASESKNVPVVHKDENAFLHTFDQIQERIRSRAYDFFLDRGFEHGDSIGDWLQAESEVLTNVSLKPIETEKEFVIEGKVEGFKPEEIEVKLEGQSLLVTGHRSESSEMSSDGVMTSSSQSLSFYQRFELPENIDRDQVDASVKRNKLRIAIPRRAES